MSSSERGPAERDATGGGIEGTARGESAGIGRAATRDDRPPRAVAMAILSVFFLSGACGLIYETVWQKELCLVFGITTYATTTILAAFMGGLAVGSYLLGKHADRVRRPLRLYALLEAGIGLFAIAFPFVVMGITAVFAGLSVRLNPAPYATALIRFAMCGIVLLVPAALMGGTLPVMSKYYVRSLRVVGSGTGRLYGLNTLGGVAGCYLAGFVFLAGFGARATLYGAALTNLALAGLALLIDRAYPFQGAPEAAEDAGPSVAIPAGSGTPATEMTVRLLLLASAVSGFCALAYEVLWTRTVTFFLQSTLYAFPTMLTSFLLGSALGSLLYAKVFDRVRNSRSLLGTVQILICVTAVLTIVEFRYLGEASAYVLRGISRQRSASVGAGFVPSMLVMLLPCLLMGIAFPLITKMFTRNISRLGRSIGSLYSANTVGCVLGAVLAGFAIIPLLGIVGGIVLVAAFNAAVGLSFLVSAAATPVRRSAVLAGGAVVLAAAGWVGTAWGDPLAFFSQRFSRVAGASDKVVFYREGVDGTITVTSRSHNAYSGVRYREISVDGVAVAGEEPLLRTTQKIQGHVPLLLFKASTGRDPEWVFTLGFGSGEASSCIVRHGIRGLDCAELIADEVAASGLFRDINHGVLTDPKFHLIINDARNHLLTTSRTYDIIQSDSVAPAVAFNTYTKEYYELCRSRLSDRGIFSTWVPLADFSTEDVRTLLHTMMSVFPHVSVWWAPNYDNKHMILVGTNYEIRIDYSVLKDELEKPAIRESLEEVGLGGITAVLGTFAADETTLRAFAGDAPLNTDDNLRLPYGIPRNAQRNDETVPGNLEVFERMSLPILPYVHNLTDAERTRIGIDAYYAARPHVLRGMRAYYLASIQQGAEEGFAGAEREYEAALAANPQDPAVRWLLDEARFYEALAAADVSMRSGKPAKALDDLEAARRIQPASPSVHNSMAFAYFAMGRRDMATDSLRKALEIAPDFVVARNNLAMLYWKSGEADRAEQEVRRALEDNPNNADALRLARLIARERGRTVDRSAGTP